MLKINTLSRRSLLKGFALTASATSLPLSLMSPALAAEPQPDLDSFLSLSSLLTGIKLDPSYLELGQNILLLLRLNYQFSLQYDSLILSFKNISIQDQNQAQQLAQQHPYPVQSIIKAWYLSQVSLTEQDRNNPIVQKLCPNLRKSTPSSINSMDMNEQQSRVIGQLDYDEALTWQACRFTKPAATCGGPFGYWADAPQTA